MSAAPLTLRMKTALVLGSMLVGLKLTLLESMIWHGAISVSIFESLHFGPIAMGVSLPVLAWIGWVAWHAEQRDNDVRGSLLLLIGADVFLLLLFVYLWGMA